MDSWKIGIGFSIGRFEVRAGLCINGDVSDFYG